MKCIYKEKSSITSTMVGTDRKLSLTGLYTLCQALGMSGSELVNWGKKQLLDKGYLWVMTRSKLVIDHLPEYQDNVTSITYPNKMDRFIFPRQYVVEDENKQVCFKMVNLFALIKEDSRKVVLPSTIEGIKFGNDTSLSGELNIPAPLKEIPNQFVYEMIVRASDIDLNHHMNNVRYTKAIIDVHDHSWYISNVIKELQIDYHKEIKEGAVVKIYSSGKINHTEQIVGKVDDTTTFIAEIVYK